MALNNYVEVLREGRLVLCADHQEFYIGCTCRTDALIVLRRSGFACDECAVPVDPCPEEKTPTAYTFYYDDGPEGAEEWIALWFGVDKSQVKVRL